MVRAIKPDHRSQFSTELLTLLRSQPLWQEAHSVLLFAPIKDEPDIWPLLKEALTAGKCVSLPRYDASADCFHAARVESIGDIERPTAFGIREPARHCAEVPLKQLDLALVPGVAFDALGWRLGRGKGYYDRLLAEVAGKKCGVAFDCQLLATLPHEPHDVKLNCLVTPTRWLEFPPASSPDAR
jgi:5-formyltetrahydrofolate cyclo-ligase